VAVAVLSLFACTKALNLDDEIEVRAQFDRFIVQYGKYYANEQEKEKRFEIYSGHLSFVQEHMKRWREGGPDAPTFTVGINKFADLTNAEFKQQFLMPTLTKTPAPVHDEERQRKIIASLPESWDWKEKGAVTPPGDQGQCGSCWAFSTVESVESCHFIYTGVLYPLSVQQLMDCSSSYGNQGCDGGWPAMSFQYIINNKGIDKAVCYPYNSSDSNGQCHYMPSCCGSTVKAYQNVTAGSEADLQMCVYQNPASVAIDASQTSFQLYTGGVYYDPGCSNTNLDHTMLAYGWGVTKDGKNTEYWSCKNSWGTNWGMGGYILMARNRNNACGIASEANLAKACGNC